MSKRHLPIIVSLGLVSILAIFAPFHVTHASSSFFGDVLGGIANGIVGVLAAGAIFIMSWVAGAIMAVLTYLIGVVLLISNNIVNTVAVQAGFKITLAVADLGFVLAIIIIAIATILHRESYGVKSALWKLVVAAILVNFSLVIGAAFIGVANTLTNTFLSQVPAFSGQTGSSAFASELAGAFEPQKAYMLNGVSTTASLVMNTNTATSITNFIVPIIGLFGALALNIVFIITLAVFLIMLLIRYVALSFLLILMPFAWLLWLFPQTSQHWRRWWNEFIRWTFFAPIVVFFLWLAIATAQAMSGANAANAALNPLAAVTGQYAASGSPILTGFLGGVVGNIAAAALSGVIVIGLAVGGIFAANKMSIVGAGAGINAMTKVKNATVGYAGKQVKKGGRAVAQKTIARPGMVQRMQRSRIIGMSAAGRGIQNLTAEGGKDLVGKASKDMGVSDMSDEALVRAAKGARGNENTLAVLQEAQKRGKLHKLEGVGKEKGLDEWLQKNDKTFKAYDQGKLKKDIENDAAIGTNAMRKAAKAKAEAAGAPAKVTDKYGFAGKQGEEADAEKLTKEAESVIANAEQKIKDYEKAGGSKIIDPATKKPIPAADSRILEHNGVRVTPNELISMAREAAKAGNDAVRDREERGNNADIVDEENLLGRGAGATAKVGKYSDAAFKKWIEGKDKSDIRKMHPEQIFAGDAKFGLTRGAIDALGKAITRGVAINSPTLASPLASKLEWKELQNFLKDYKRSIDVALNAGEINQAHYDNLVKLMKGLRKGSLTGSYGDYIHGAETEPSSSPPPSSPPPSPPPAGSTA